MRISKTHKVSGGRYLFRLSHTTISRVPPVAFVLMLSLGLNTLGLTWGLPNYVDWAQDSIVLQTLGAIAKRFSNGWFDRVPPVQYVVLACFYTPYIGYLFSPVDCRHRLTYFRMDLRTPFCY